MREKFGDSTDFSVCHTLREERVDFVSLMDWALMDRQARGYRKKFRSTTEMMVPGESF